jgi:hypothetical protein
MCEIVGCSLTNLSSTSSPVRSMHVTQPDETADEITFGAGDLDLLDLALRSSPELRLATLLVRCVRRSAVVFPIKTLEVLKDAIPGGELSALGHSVGPSEVELFFPAAFLPVESEADLLVKISATLRRCSLEQSKVSKIDPAIYDHFKSAGAPATQVRS